MSMVWLKTLLDPTVLLLLIFVSGFCLGKIRVFKISLDLSAILITAVITGFLISRFVPYAIDSDFQNGLTVINKIGTALFMSSIGLSSGISFSKGMTRQDGISLLSGALMSVVGYSCMLLITLVDKNIDHNILIGILCGALTSTPALSIACENSSVNDKIVLGYSSSYIIGVLSIVLFVQVMLRRTDNKTNCMPNKKTVSDISLTSLILISISTLIGHAVFVLNEYFSYVEFGTSACILISGIIIGYILSKFLREFSCDFSLYRNLGLIMFFVGTGVPAGTRINVDITIITIAYSLLLSAMPIFLGYIFTRYIIKLETFDTLSILSGGMTSTPAINVLLRNSDKKIKISSYSMAYIGALVTLIFLI